MLRHINAYATAPLPFSNDYQNDEDNYYEDDNNSQANKSLAENLILSDEVTVQVKKESLNPTQKLALREEILGFLDMSRNEEIDLVDYTQNNLIINNYSD
jgi:hypothetical protein